MANQPRPHWLCFVTTLFCAQGCATVVRPPGVEVRVDRVRFHALTGSLTEAEAARLGAAYRTAAALAKSMSPPGSEHPSEIHVLMIDDDTYSRLFDKELSTADYILGGLDIRISERLSSFGVTVQAAAGANAPEIIFRDIIFDIDASAEDQEHRRRAQQFNLFEQVALSQTANAPPWHSIASSHLAATEAWRSDVTGESPCLGRYIPFEILDRPSDLIAFLSRAALGTPFAKQTPIISLAEISTACTSLDAAKGARCLNTAFSLFDYVATHAKDSSPLRAIRALAEPGAERVVPQPAFEAHVRRPENTTLNARDRRCWNEEEPAMSSSPVTRALSESEVKTLLASIPAGGTSF